LYFVACFGLTSFLHILPWKYIGEYLQKTKCFEYLYKFSQKHMIIPIAVQTDITITVRAVHFRVNIWVYSNKSVTLEFSTDVQKVFTYILNFTKFRPVVAQIFHLDRKTDKHTWRSWQSISADIPTIGVVCVSVGTHTWHTGCSVRNIPLQFPQHTALKTTNPLADHTVLERLKSYILCTFLFQETSCVMLSSSSYKHPFVTQEKLPIISFIYDHTLKLNRSYS